MGSILLVCFNRCDEQSAEANALLRGDYYRADMVIRAFLRNRWTMR